MPRKLDDKFLQDQLRECIDMAGDDCKNPQVAQALTKIDEHIDDSKEFRREFREGQERLTTAMIDVARSQEKLISLHDRTQHNHDDINRLFTISHENEKRITDHLIRDHSYREQPGQAPDPSTANRAAKFDKVQTTLIVGVLTWFGTVAYNGFMELVHLINKLNGGP